MKVLAYGEILWDIINGEKYLGGAPLNFAAHAVKCGSQAGIISCLGQDELGNQALNLVEKLEVDTSFVQRIEGKDTGTVPVTLIDGQPEYDITPDVAFDYIDAKAIDFSKIGTCDAFYFGSLIQRNEQSKSTLYHILQGCRFEIIFYDVNLRKNCFSKEIIEKSLEYCTILKVNDDEVTTLSELLFNVKLTVGDFSVSVSKEYPQVKLIITTAGKKGCLLYSDNKLSRIPGVPVKVLDTVGAGDAFSAAFLCTYLRNRDYEKAAQIANEVGGFVASSVGPLPDYRPEIQALLN